MTTKHFLKMTKSFISTNGTVLMLTDIKGSFLGLLQPPSHFRKKIIKVKYTNESTALSWFYRKRKKLLA